MGISLIAIVIITNATTSANIQTSYTQQNQTTLINQTKWTNYFENSKDFKKCYGDPSGTCFNQITVLYESPNTIALTSEFEQPIWKAVDTVKQDGYELDDAISYVEGGYSPQLHITAIMSK